MKPAPALSRGDTVEVREDNRRPWRGEVLSVKPTRSAWWVEVRGEDGLVWVLPPRYVQKGDSHSQTR